MTTNTAQAAAKRTTPLIMSLAEYEAIPESYRSVWDTERTDWQDWNRVRNLYMGKRGMLRNNALWIEGINFVIKEADTGSYEIVGEPGQFARVTGLKEAIRQASLMVSMPAHHNAHFESCLRDTGRATWGYGFCTVEINLVSAAH